MKTITLPGNVLFWGSLAAALACLAAGYWLAGMGWGGVIALSLLAGWITGRRFRWSWLPGTFLTVFTAAAAGGLLLGVSFHWMAAGLVTALAAYELGADKAGLEANAVFRNRFQVRRAALLGLVVLFGLLAAEAGTFLNFTIPFGGLGLAALAVLYGLVKLFGVIKSN
ncbi:MAG: hypothetical protein AB9891_00980 [Anaerolineaceae bacterium]